MLTGHCKQTASLLFPVCLMHGKGEIFDLSQLESLCKLKVRLMFRPIGNKSQVQNVALLIIS